jgi:hypothetical protein
MRSEGATGSSTELDGGAYTVAGAAMVVVGMVARVSGSKIMPRSSMAHKQGAVHF